MFPGVWHQNIQIQIHKYTNTVWAKIINNNIIIIIQLQKQIPELCSKQLLFFWFDIHNNMFPNIVKKVFLKKKLKNVNVTSHHQAIINNNIIIIKLQKRIPELCSKQLLVFWFDIHNNMFPHIVKKKNSKMYFSKIRNVFWIIFEDFPT